MNYFINKNIADPGVRDRLPIPVGTIIGNGAPGGTVAPLRTGQVGDEGFFVLDSAPRSWVDAGPTDNGLLNFYLAESGEFGRESEEILDEIDGVRPLRSEELSALVGSTFCAVVYDSDVSVDFYPPKGNLQGANLGTIDFTVLAVGEPRDDGMLPDITIEVVEPEEYTD